ncbi:MAG: hypothetical protein HC876_01595 [Chloroflexaceae bacterium]|nr:hypothetical protein [Chloroflexaceae bacterium]
MKTLAHNQSHTPSAAHTIAGTPAVLLHPLGWPLLLVLILSILAGALAYQSPPQGAVTVGWLGDQLFLNTSAGLGGEAVQQGAFYPDDLTPDSPTTRSRWTRQSGYAGAAQPGERLRPRTDDAGAGLARRCARPTRTWRG